MSADPQQMHETDEESESLAQRFKSWLRSNLRGDSSLKEALEEVLEDHQEDGEHLPHEEQSMIKNVLGFADLTVGDIMTPRADIKAVECQVVLDELTAHIVQNAHTRIPVYNDTLDNIKGFIHIKDLMPFFSGVQPFNLALILRDLLFVPPSMQLMNLLVKMRESGVHIAIVIDEYGGTDGLVTLEDVFEEIVGEIQDEHDEEETTLPLGWNTLGYCDVDALTRIEKLEGDLRLALKPEEDGDEFDTLGGLIFYQLGRVPAKGEIIAHPGGAKFEILAADPRRIRRVRITAPILPPPEGNE